MDLLCEWGERNADSIEEFGGLFKKFFFFCLPFLDGSLQSRVLFAEIKTTARVFFSMFDLA